MPPTRLIDVPFPFGRGPTRLRLLMLLTLALLPLGLISVTQSTTLLLQAKQMSERALLGETIRAAAAQRDVIQTALGKAEALAALLRKHTHDRSQCSALLEQFSDGEHDIGAAVFFGAAGEVTCTSPMDRAMPPLSVEMLADLWAQQPGSGPGPFIGPDAVLVSAAVLDRSGGLLGHAVLALPRDALAASASRPAAVDVPVSLVTFAADGRIVAGAEAPELLPETQSLASFGGGAPHAFTTSAADSTERVYAVVPVVEGALYVLGTWEPGAFFAGSHPPILSFGLVLPLMMLAVTLLVAYVAISRMVILPLGLLRERMQTFAEGTRDFPPLDLGRAPDELIAVPASFQPITARILTDEAQLAKSLHDQEVLLKEVHHRVKNNLQLIASILNMQQRQQRTPEARAILRRVQDRVMGLATVHQHLYQSSELSGLRADALVREIVNRMLGTPHAETIDVDMFLSPVTLYPDQAVPLALLVSEAMTNVLAYIGPAAGGMPKLTVRLVQKGQNVVELDIVNSVPSAAQRTARPEQAGGLGTQLINAFATQLGAEVHRDLTDTEHRLRVAFDEQGFTAPPQSDRAVPGTQSTTL